MNTATITSTATASNLTNDKAVNMNLWVEAVSLAKDQMRHGKFHFSELTNAVSAIYDRLVKLDAMNNRPANAVLIPKVQKVEKVVKPVQMTMNFEGPKGPTIKVFVPRPATRNPLSVRNKKNYMTKCNTFLKEHITSETMVNIEQRGTHAHGLTNRFRVHITVMGIAMDITRIVATACGLRYSKPSKELYIHGYGENFLTILIYALSAVVFGQPRGMRLNIC